MPTLQTEEREELRSHIPQEQSIPLGRHARLDYRFAWMIGLALIGLFGLIVSAKEGLLPVGIMFFVLLALFYIFWIQVPALEGGKTTLLAKSYRRTRHSVLGVFGFTRYESDQPLKGETFGTRIVKKPDKGPPPIKMLGPTRFVPYVQSKDTVTQPTDPPLGLARTGLYKTLSATMLAKGSSLLSVDSDTQGRRMAGFARLLDLAAENGNIYRIAWRDQTLLGEPQNGAALREYISQASGLTPSTSSESEALFDQHLAEMGEKSVTHRTTLTLSLYEPTVKKIAKSLGGPSAVLVQQLAQFYQTAMGTDGLSSIGLRHATFLDINELILENRLALDPFFAEPYLKRGASQQPPGIFLSEHDAWPGYADFKSPDYCRLGSTYHVGFYIYRYTRHGLLPEDFWSILKVPVPKIVTTVVQLVPALQAQKRAEYASTGTRSVQVDRIAKQQRITEAEVLSTERALAYEREVAEARGQTGRIRSYVDVMGRDLDEVMANAERVRVEALSKDFWLQPLVGRHHRAVQASMPIAGGLEAFQIPATWS